MNKYLDCKKGYNNNDLQDASNIIRNGGLVLFPTETVYGIGANGLDAVAVEKIFKAKGRKNDNPLILHVSNKAMINTIAKDISDLEEKIIDTFCPGPLTIILNKKDNVPSNATGGLNTVGIRMPNNKIAHDLISLANVPIAAPSANISGKPSGTNIEDIFEELNDKVDYIIDDGKTEIGLESTVIRVIDEEIHILRPGKITVDDLKIITNKVIIDKHVLGGIQNDDKILSPGMKYKHYAPKTKCILVYSDNKDILINKIKELSNDNSNSLVLCNETNLKHFNNALSMGRTLEEISKNIFTLLRKVDTLNIDYVIIEGVESTGLGLAIMNRLIRACSHNFIKL